MKSIALFLPFLALSCCTRDAIKPGAYVTQAEVPKARPVSEAVTPVREAAAKSSLSSEFVAKATRSLREDLATATAEADRLRKVEVISAEEKNALWLRLTEITRRSILLEGEAEEGRRHAADLTSRIGELEIAAREKDEEAKLLQVQYQDERGKAKAAHDLARLNAEAASEWKGKADSRGGQLKVFLWISVFAVGIAAVVVWLQTANPLSFLNRFRR